MSETKPDKSRIPMIGQINAQLWTAFGAAAGMQIELEVYDRSIAMGQLSNVEGRLPNFANELYHEQTIGCATEAGTICAKMARDQGLERITADIFEKAAEEVRISQQGNGSSSPGAMPRGGIC